MLPSADQWPSHLPSMDHIYVQEVLSCTEQFVHSLHFFHCLYAQIAVMLHIFRLAAFKVFFRGYNTSTEQVQGYKYNHATNLTSTCTTIVLSLSMYMALKQVYLQ